MGTYGRLVRTAFGVAAIALCQVGFAEEIGSKEFDRSTACLTARLLLERVRQDILSEPSDPAILTAVLTNAPSRYLDPKQAREALRATYRDSVVSRYAAEADAVLTKLSHGVQPSKLLGEAFVEESRTLPAGKLDEAVRRDYDRVFSKARETACALQRQLFVSSVRPTEEEFETRSREELLQLLTERISAEQIMPVFEENVPYLTKVFAEPLVNEAKKQRNEQRQWLERTEVRSRTPDLMAAELSDGLAVYWRKREAERKEKGEIAYGLFPSIRSSIPQVAEQRSLQRLEQLIRETRLSMKPEDILAQIEASPREHRTLDDSIKAFRPLLQKQLKESVFSSVSSMDGESGWQAEKPWLEEAVERNERICRVVTETIDNQFLPQVKAARETCSELQVRQLFPRLRDRSWHPEPALVDFACAQPDWDGTIREWREFAQMEDFARVAEEQPLMEESERNVLELVRRAFAFGRKARVRQHSIVDEQVDSIRTALTDRRVDADLEALVPFYREEVLKQWKDEYLGYLWEDIPEEERPEDYEQQHFDLFPSTQERIELRARSLLEVFEKEEAERREKEKLEEVRPEEKPIEEPEEKPEEKTPPPLEPVEVLCSFELLRENDRILILCLADEQAIGRVYCTESRHDFQKRAPEAAREVSELFASYIRKSISEGVPLKVRTSVLVKDPFVYYGMITELSRVLRESVRAFENEGISIQLGGGIAAEDEP